MMSARTARAHAFGIASVDSFLFVGPHDGPPPANLPPDDDLPDAATLPDPLGADAAKGGLDVADGAIPDETRSTGEKTSLGDPSDAEFLADLPRFAGSPGVVGASKIAFFDEVGLVKPTDKPGNGGGKGGDGDNGGDTGGTILSSYTSGGNPKQEYNIEINFSGSWTVALQQAFIDASELISDIITADISDVAVPGYGKVDDIVIDASLVYIDGDGGILGQAGPRYYRTANNLPATGVMEFDIADAENYDSLQLFNDIVFHEMVHCIGFGGMWDLMGLVSETGHGLRFTGDNATTEYQAFLAASGQTDDGAAFGVPVESDFGPGTRGSHWNDGEFEPDGTSGDDQFGLGNEIMTGFINHSGNYLSDITIAALQDMGYQTIHRAGEDVAASLDLTIFTDHLVADDAFA